MPLQNAYSETSLGYQQITSLGTAVGFTSIPAGTLLVLVTPEAQAVRWRADRTDPTASVGYPLAVGVEARFTLAQLASVKFIEQTAGAKLNCAFFG